MFYRIQCLFILARLARTHLVGNDTMHTHFEIFQDGSKRIKVPHLGRSERLRKFRKGSIDKRSTAILTKQRRSALVLIHPGKYKWRILLVKARPRIVIMLGNSTTKQFQTESITRHTLFEKFVGLFGATTSQFVDQEHL